MRTIIAAALLIGFSRIANAQATSQPPSRLDAACPGSLAASSSYPANVIVTLLGQDFIQGTRILSTQQDVVTGSAFVSSTQMLVALRGSALAAPGRIDLQAYLPDTSPRLAGGARIGGALQPRLLESNILPVRILSPPTLTVLNPAQTTETAPLALSIAGGEFISSNPNCPVGTPAPSLIWNGTAVNTPLLVSSTTIVALVPQSLLTPGRATVAIQNPLANGAVIQDSGAIGGTVPTPLDPKVFSNSLPLTINPRPVITTASLPVGVGGMPYSPGRIGITGGTLPIVWSLSQSATGLSIDANGQITGALPPTGPFTFQVFARDAASVVASATYTVNVLAAPVVRISVVPDPVLLADPQNAVTVALSQPPAGTVTGNLSLQFQPDPGVVGNRNGVDPSVRLSATQFTITPSQPSARVPVQTGLAAGTLTVTASNIQVNGLDATPATLPLLVTRIAPAPPTVQSACLKRDPALGLGLGALTVSVTGFSNTREVTRARFLLSGGRLADTELSVNNANALFAPYYDTNFIPFSYQQTLLVSGDSNDVGSVSVILENSQGASAPFRASPSCP